MNKLRMRRDYILIRPLEQEPQRAGKILLPDTAQKLMLIGEVVDCQDEYPGPNGSVIKVGLQAGDKVIYAPSNRYLLREGTEEYHILREMDLFAVIGGEDGQ